MCSHQVVAHSWHHQAAATWHACTCNEQPQQTLSAVLALAQLLPAVVMQLLLLLLDAELTVRAQSTAVAAAVGSRLWSS